MIVFCNLFQLTTLPVCIWRDVALGMIGISILNDTHFKIVVYLRCGVLHLLNNINLQILSLVFTIIIYNIIYTSYKNNRLNYYKQNLYILK